MHFIDPHFHYWDCTEQSKTGHSVKILGLAGERYPTYLPSHYVADMEKTGLKLKKAVFVEAISSSPITEAKWCCAFLEDPAVSHIKQAVVPRANFLDDHQNVEKLLQEYASYPAIKGIRQIVNHHPTNPKLTWPNVTEDFLLNATWKKNFGLLSKYNFSFDLQLNPHQMKAAAELISQHANIPIIVNHMGCLFLGVGEEAQKNAIHVWREGMSLLAKLPNVSVKISMLTFTKPKWEHDKQSNELMKSLVNEVISMFGTKRCMFASNYPVDEVDIAPNVLYKAFLEMVSHLTPEQQQDLFYNTADRVYRL